LQNFELEIPEGRENDRGYVELAHCQQYSILVTNYGSEPCDAGVFVDGRWVGAWRIDSRGRARLERPAHDTGRFTFYKADTGEGRQAGLVRDDSLGLISVEFRPQKPSQEKHSLYSSNDVSVAGGTGLSGRSAQRFGEAEALTNYDEDNFVTINLRLICSDTPRPLFPSSTPIPPVRY